MGIAMSIIYFEKGIPSMEKIRKQFKKQTGLEIEIKASLNIDNITINTRNIVEKLSLDIDKYEEISRRKNIENIDQFNKEKSKLNYIDFFELYNYQFYGIEFYVEGNTIDLIYGPKRFYFPVSLEKMFYDLGGEFMNDDNTIINDWAPPRYWKKLKHWHEYKWYNRPRK